ncbi:MAG: AMP-binding protein [Magnetococcales bacterium]|nr:AMP-binding protein [Magnetococcales bacterium]
MNTQNAPAISTHSEDNIAQWFHRSACQQGSRPALFVDEKLYNYSELKNYALQIASTIERLDPHPANPVAAVFAYRSLTAYGALLAILYAGKGYVPLNPTFPVARNLRMADLAEVDLLILDSHCEPLAEDLLRAVQRNLLVLLPDHETAPPWTQTLSRHRFLLRDEIFSLPPTLQSPKQPQTPIAYLLFTSGSTGVPKGVMVSPGNVNAFVSQMLERYQPTPEDRFSQHSDLTFDASVHDQFVCWAAGACLYCIPQKSRMAPAQFIREHGLTFWESVPAVIHFMKRMYLLKPGFFPSLRWSIFGGEQLTMEAVQWWQAAAPHSRIENSYGPTEGTICITGYVWQTGRSEADCDRGVVPIGTPYAGQRAALLVHGQLHENVENIKGELCLSGSQITPGYWKNAAETERCYLELPEADGQRQRWYKTGDLAIWRAGVGFSYVDRLDRQLKIRGYRVELAEIEQVLRQVAGTEQVAVLGWPPGGGNVTSVVGFVCASSLADAEILTECTKRLPYYMVPRQIRRLSQLPLNANGKTDLNQLLLHLSNDTVKN